MAERGLLVGIETGGIRPAMREYVAHGDHAAAFVGAESIGRYDSSNSTHGG
jgi:hypothetical protein